MRNILKTNGWAKGTLKDSGGRCCLVGAWVEAEGYDATEAQGGDGTEWTKFKENRNKEVENILGECIGMRVPFISTLTAYNDRNERTKTEIMETISCAIEKAK